MADICERCFNPGQCCKNLHFRNRNGVLTFWDDVPIDDQMRELRHPLDKDLPQPFYVDRVEERFVVPDDDPNQEHRGKVYYTAAFACRNLTAEGRCGDYENRPWLCRAYASGMDPTCVHFMGRTEAMEVEVPDMTLTEIWDRCGAAKEGWGDIEIADWNAREGDTSSMEPAEVIREG